MAVKRQISLKILKQDWGRFERSVADPFQPVEDLFFYQN